jgi:hypothetical protein
MSVALITVAPVTVLSQWGQPPPVLVIPGLGDVHGAQVGWTSPDGIYMLADLIKFVPPPGQMITGNPSYVLNGTTVTETYATVPLPPSTTAGTKYSNAIAAGIILTWSSSTTLNGTYAIDPVTMSQLNSVWTVLVANNFFPNGTALQPWKMMNGTAVKMGAPQFKNFGTALSKYVAQLGEARDAEAGGGTPTWPSNQVTITG